MVQSWEHETRKPRVSCFVYIDTNTRTQNRNTKQTRKKSKQETNTKIEKFPYNPRNF